MTSALHCVMLYSGGDHQTSQQKSLLCYSDKQTRASIVDVERMASRNKQRGNRRRRKQVGRRRMSRKKPTRTNGVRIIAGRVLLRVAGYKTRQNLPSSQLVRYIPITKLRIAAKKVLKSSPKSNASPKRRRRRSRKH